jgi:hypothetical protein
MGFLIIACILPDLGYAQPHFTTNIADAGTLRAFTSAAWPGNVLDKETHQDLGPDLFIFSALHYEQTGLDGYESSVIAGFGRHLFDSENLRLDVDLGAGQRVVQPQQSVSPIEDPVTHLGLRLIIQPGSGPFSLRHDLVIETERSSTTSESMVTWSYEVNPRLALELTSAARKRFWNPSVDPLEVPHRASFTLNWAF